MDNKYEAIIESVKEAITVNTVERFDVRSIDDDEKLISAVQSSSSEYFEKK